VFTLAIPPGWQATVGDEASALRVTLHHAATGARVEVWTFSGVELRPRPRAACRWTFTDSGPYGPLGLQQPVVTANCMPDDPAQPRVFATILGRRGRTWQFETHAPGRALGEAIDAADAVLATAEWPQD